MELAIDKNGSPVTLEAGSWFVCFVPGLRKQWWHALLNDRHEHVFAMRPAGTSDWLLFEPWWHRLLTATISSDQARKFLLWGARGDVLLVRESIPGHGSQIRGWMTCATLASFLLGRRYWVWTPHGLYKLLLRERNVCRVDVSVLLTLDAAELARGSRVIVACDECAPDLHRRRPGAPKPFCMNCGRDLTFAAGVGYSNSCVSSLAEIIRPSVRSRFTGKVGRAAACCSHSSPATVSIAVTIRTPSLRPESLLIQFTRAAVVGCRLWR